MNSCMPRTAKSSWIASSTLRTFRTAGKALRSEVSTIRMPALRESSRSGRSARRTRRGFRKASAGTSSASSAPSEIRSSEKSSTFHPVRRYPCGVQ